MIPFSIIVEFKVFVVNNSLTHSRAHVNRINNYSILRTVSQLALELNDKTYSLFNLRTHYIFSNRFNASIEHFIQSIFVVQIA